MPIINLDITWLNKYSVWKEVHMTTDLDFLVLNFIMMINIKSSI